MVFVATARLELRVLRALVQTGEAPVHAESVTHRIETRPLDLSYTRIGLSED
jgi:hypothetical protein